MQPAHIMGYNYIIVLIRRFFVEQDDDYDYRDDSQLDGDIRKTDNFQEVEYSVNHGQIAKRVDCFHGETLISRVCRMVYRR